HALAVERHGFGIHVGHSGILHDLLVDAIAMLTRLVDDPCEDDSLIRLELNALRERGELTWLYVVSDTLRILKGTVFTPDFARVFRHAAISLKFGFRNGDHKAV